MYIKITELEAQRIAFALKSIGIPMQNQAMREDDAKTAQEFIDLASRVETELNNPQQKFYQLVLK